MLDLATATHHDFAACLAEPFLLDAGDGSGNTHALELVEVEAQARFDPAIQSRQPFSLLFRGAPETPLGQGTYRLDNERLGPMTLFLVPIGPDTTGMRYEAVFA